LEANFSSSFRPKHGVLTEMPTNHWVVQQSVLFGGQDNKPNKTTTKTTTPMQALRRSYNSETKAVWLTLFPVVCGACLWAGFFGFRTFAQHNDVVLKSKGAEPYLKRESPKLLARERAIKQAHKWSEEMGGQDSYFPNGGK